ncbi:phospholipase-like protein [Artemisia annua]|uniref:Phospholipase-like protein n=1 Tax=Artemisia annua TaxID=35608 RepID=A0A2U1LJG9_ARTAN|nr:phospholipase-like protein [Artemisia annua]
MTCSISNLKYQQPPYIKHSTLFLDTTTKTQTELKHLLIVSPVRTELAKKVLKNYADKLNPDIPDMTVRRCLHSQSEKKHEKKTLSVVETPTQSKSVTKVKGKRKRNVEQIQPAELGENLVGSRIKVWWPEDNAYYEGIVKSFQSRKKKHKVWYDDGDKELLDLKAEQWELVEEVSPMSDCAQSAEHGESLVGRRIKVWWPANEGYSVGVMQSFDSSKMKHKVLYDDGDEDVLDLNQRRWMLLEDVAAIEPIPDSQGQVLPTKGLSTQALPIKGSSTQAPPEKVSCILALPKKGSSTHALHEKIWCILGLPKKVYSTQAPEKGLYAQAPPKKVSSALALPEKVSSTQALPMNVSTTQSCLKCVQGYKVKKSIAPILEAILEKYGDIASDCVFKTPSVRASILEVICEIFIRIQTNDVTELISEMEEIECQVSAAEVYKINVSWLRQHLSWLQHNLDAIHKRMVTKEKCSLLCKGKANVSLVNRAAKRDLEEAQIELLTAQERFRKAERRVEVLNLVEKRLKDSLFEESKAELDSWITV